MEKCFLLRPLFSGEGCEAASPGKGGVVIKELMGAEEELGPPVVRI